MNYNRNKKMLEHRSIGWAEAKTIEDKILSELIKGDLSAMEISDRTDIRLYTVTAACRQLKNKGIICRLRRRWALVQKT